MTDFNAPFHKLSLADSAAAQVAAVATLVRIARKASRKGRKLAISNAREAKRFERSAF